jgi:hypothetical protein
MTRLHFSYYIANRIIGLRVNRDVMVGCEEPAIGRFQADSNTETHVLQH